MNIFGYDLIGYIALSIPLCDVDHEVILSRGTAGGWLYRFTHCGVDYEFPLNEQMGDFWNDAAV